MRNHEHYIDPTASIAVKEVARTQPMRFYSTPAYVAGQSQQSNPFKPSTPIGEMDMAELKPYINSCAKSKMDPMVCIDCTPGCVFGRRAIELMEQATKPAETEKVNKAAVANRTRSIREYQAAIDSGDVMKYAMEHAKSPDPKRAKAAAAARVAFWRKNYGALIKETPREKPTQVPVAELIDNAPEEQPHLMQMPCLSKKVAAERAAAAKEAEANPGIAQVFMNKLNSLKDAMEKIQQQIDDLTSNRDEIARQISAIEETAGVLDVVLT